MQAHWVAAISAAAMIMVAPPALPQTTPPTVIQVQPAGAAETAGSPGLSKTSSATLQVAGDVTFANGEGPIAATLGDLLAKSGAAGLEKAHVLGRVRRVSAAGATVGQVIWTSVAIDDDGETRSAPLANPLKSAFPMKSATIATGSRIKVEGDIDALLSTARGLTKKVEKKEVKEQTRPAATQATAAPATALGGAGASNDIARNFQPLPPQAPAAPAATPIPPSPNLTVTTNGCEPRIDTAAGFVVIQNQTLSNGQPTGTGCTDTIDRIAIQKAFGTCPDLVTGNSAQPQFKLFWVAQNGTTNFIGDCQPDTSTNFAITANTAACPAGPDMTTLNWAQQGEQVYTNRNNQIVVVSPCAPVTKTPLQIGKDFASCPAQIDQTKGLVSPEFKASFVNPVTQQSQDFTSCQADPTSAVAIQKDFAACADVVGSSTAQRQFQQFYLDQTGTRVNIGSCQADTTTSFPIQTTFAGCTDFVDQAKRIAEAESWQFYLNAQGQSVTVKDCAPDPTTQTALQQDYTACPTSVNQAAGIAEDAYQLFYMDRTNTRQNVGSCTLDPNRLYVVQRDFTSCLDLVDVPDLKAQAQFTTYYVDVAGTTHPVNKQCAPQVDIFPIKLDATVCPVAVDTAKLLAQEQAQLFYLNRVSARVIVQDCHPDATPPFPVVATPLGCSLRLDFNDNAAIQQTKLQYTKADNTVVDATQCADSTNPSDSFAMTPVFGVCPDLVLSDNSAAFKQVRLEIAPPSGKQFVTECQPSNAPGDEAQAQATPMGCETIFFNFVDQMQSFGAQRFFYQFPGGPQVFLTQCVQDNALLYPMQSEIGGWVNNDPQKTAQPKTTLFILPPVGRVDVSASQLRAGAPNVAYKFQSEANTGVANSTFYQGCEAFQQTQLTDTYLRPDNTETAYVVGPGPNQDLGDRCTRVTQNQTVYYQTIVSGAPGYLYQAGPGIYVFDQVGIYTNQPSANACIESGQGQVDVAVYNITQTRVAATLPAAAGGTTSFSPWTNFGPPILIRNFSC